MNKQQSKQRSCPTVGQLEHSAIKINQLHRSITKVSRDALVWALEAGAELMLVRKQLRGSGTSFTKWMDANITVCRSTAFNYIKLKAYHDTSEQSAEKIKQCESLDSAYVLCGIKRKLNKTEEIRQLEHEEQNGDPPPDYLEASDEACTPAEVQKVVAIGKLAERLNFHLRNWTKTIEPDLIKYVKPIAVWYSETIERHKKQS